LKNNLSSPSWGYSLTSNSPKKGRNSPSQVHKTSSFQVNDRLGAGLTPQTPQKASPEKVRPQTGYQSPVGKFRRAGSGRLLRSPPRRSVDVQKAQAGRTNTTINIIQELNGQRIESQSKDLEIERLTTTCQALNARARIAEELENTIKVLQNRLVEGEVISGRYEEELHAKEKTIISLQ